MRALLGALEECPGRRFGFPITASHLRHGDDCEILRPIPVGVAAHQIVRVINSGFDDARLMATAKLDKVLANKAGASILRRHLCCSLFNLVHNCARHAPGPCLAMMSGE